MAGAISAGEFRNGVTFEMDGNVLQIVEFQHVKPGKGAAFVRTKCKNVITGSVVERTFNPTDKFETAYVERKEMQYLYSDGELYYFMDMESYEQLPLNADVLGDGFKFVKAVVPGDTLTLEAKVLLASSGLYKFSVKASVDGQLRAKGELAFTAAKKAQLYS